MFASLLLFVGDPCSASTLGTDGHSLRLRGAKTEQDNEGQKEEDRIGEREVTTLAKTCEKVENIRQCSYTTRDW